MLNNRRKTWNPLSKTYILGIELKKRKWRKLSLGSKKKEKNEYFLNEGDIYNKVEVMFVHFVQEEGSRRHWTPAVTIIYYFLLWKILNFQ